MRHEAFYQPADLKLPRWYRVAKSDPNRWVHHDPPMQGHYTSQQCTVCTNNPPPPSWEMLDEAEATAVDLEKEVKRLKTQIGEGGAERFDEVRVERDDLLERLDRYRRANLSLQRQVEQLTHQPTPEPKKRWWRP